MSLLYPEEGKEGKTERGSSKKREDARNDGKVVCSQEINTVAVLAVSYFFYTRLSPYLKQSIIELLGFWEHIDVTAVWDIVMVQGVFVKAFKVWFFGAISVGCVAVAASIVASISQTRPFFSTDVLKWKFDSLNPMTGAKQLFSKDSIMKLGLSLMKVCLISTVVWATVRAEIPELVSLHRLHLVAGIDWYMNLLGLVIWRILVLYIIIAIIDWIKEKRKFESGIMMTRQEVKDEAKNQEGSPQVKRQVRKKMQELTMSRMMASVPDASVVITNPTFIAIAVKYDAEMGAPVVVAKGKRLTAQRIREIADENGVPILERKPLARAMYSKIKVGSPVPTAFYEAIAELLAYLYKIGDERIHKQLSPD